jgi:hypothetical protein
MDRLLLPLAQLVAFAGILAGAYAVVVSAKTTAVATTASEPRAQRAEQQAQPQEIPGQQMARDAALPPRIGAPISAARPPVPLLLNPRPMREAAESQPAEATPDSAVTGQTDQKVPSDAGAKAMIEADGYKNARAVAKAPDGSWRGFAMRGAVEVAVSVDDHGNVSTQ